MEDFDVNLLSESVILESLDSASKFYMTEDSKPPTEFYASFEVKGKAYHIALIRTTLTGIYELSFGKRISKNVGWWKYHQPSDALAVISTMVNFAQTAITHEGYGKHIRGITLPITAPKSQIDRIGIFVKRVIKQKFIESMTYVDVSYDNEEDTSDALKKRHIFVVRKGLSGPSLFSGKKFSSVTFKEVDGGTSEIFGDEKAKTISVENGKPIPDGVIGNLQTLKKKKLSVKTEPSKKLAYMNTFAVDTGSLETDGFKEKNTGVDAILKTINQDEISKFVLNEPKPKEPEVQPDDDATQEEPRAEDIFPKNDKDGNAKKSIVSFLEKDLLSISGVEIKLPSDPAEIVSQVENNLREAKVKGGSLRLMGTLFAVVDFVEETKEIYEIYKNFIDNNGAFGVVAPTRALAFHSDHGTLGLNNTNSKETSPLASSHIKNKIGLSSVMNSETMASEILQKNFITQAETFKVEAGDTFGDVVEKNLGQEAKATGVGSTLLYMVEQNIEKTIDGVTSTVSYLLDDLNKLSPEVFKHSISADPASSYSYAIHLLTKIGLKPGYNTYHLKNTIRNFVLASPARKIAQTIQEKTATETKYHTTRASAIVYDLLAGQGDQEYAKAYGTTLALLRGAAQTDSVSRFETQAKTSAKKVLKFTPTASAFRFNEVKDLVQTTASGEKVLPQIAVSKAPDDVFEKISGLPTSVPNAFIFGFDKPMIEPASGQFSMYSKAATAQLTKTEKEVFELKSKIQGTWNYKKHLKTLSGISAVKSYTGSAYMTYNGNAVEFVKTTLQEMAKFEADKEKYGKPSDKKKDEITKKFEHVQNMFKAFEEVQPLPEPLLVFRNLDYSDEYHGSLDIGSDYVDPRFLSTTVNPFVSMGGSTMKIRVVLPAGSKVIPILDSSNHPGEDEVILPPMSFLRVVRIEKIYRKNADGTIDHTKVQKCAMACVYLGTAWKSFSKGKIAKMFTGKDTETTNPIEEAIARVRGLKLFEEEADEVQTFDIDNDAEYEPEGKFGGSPEAKTAFAISDLQKTGELELDFGSDEIRRLLEQ